MTQNLTFSGEETIRRIISLDSQFDGVRAVGDAVVSMVTLVEAHVDRTIDELFTSSGALDNAVGAILFRDARDGHHRTWQNRYSCLSRYFEIKLSGTASAQDFDTLVDLRNSIVHGNGRITDQQSPTYAKLSNLRMAYQARLGVQCHGRRVLLVSELSDKAAQICWKFVPTFDSAVLERYPTLRVES